MEAVPNSKVARYKVHKSVMYLVMRFLIHQLKYPEQAAKVSLLHVT